jgi:hypothetical protein
VEHIGPIALAYLAEAAEERLALLLALLSRAGQRQLRLASTRVLQAPQVPPQAVDVEVENVLRDLAAAAGAGRSQAAQQGSLLGRRGPERIQPVLEQAQDHVHIAPFADGLGQPAQHLGGLADGPALTLAGEERQSHAEPPSRHPDLVDGLVVAGYGSRKLVENAGHAIFEQPGRTIVAGYWGCCHGRVTEGP